jgi:hypothetical protein
MSRGLTIFGRRPRAGADVSPKVALEEGRLARATTTEPGRDRAAFDARAFPAGAVGAAMIGTAIGGVR